MKKLSELKAAKYNPRSISDEALKGLGYSLKEFGDLSGIVFNTRTSNLVAGHQRVKALQTQYGDLPIVKGYIKANGDRFAVRLVDWPKEKEIAANIAANSPTIQGEFIADLQDLLAGIQLDLPEVFENLNLDDLLLELGQKSVGLTDPDEIPETMETRCKPGDLWQLGRHRLLCGDATNADDMERLMERKRADCLLTDPPYGVDYSGKNEFLNAYDKGNRIQVPIENDAIEDYREFFGAFLSLVPFADYNTFYIFMSSKELHNLRLAIDDTMCMWGDYLIWVKNNHILGRKDYKFKHEFIVYGWKGKHKFYGGFSTTILEFDKSLKSEYHPTMKPVELTVKIMQDGSNKGALIVDLFLGSGTTLIAAEKTGRTCYGMEIEPHYCDVAIQRWENFTGQKAELIQ